MCYYDHKKFVLFAHFAHFGGVIHPNPKVHPVLPLFTSFFGWKREKRGTSATQTKNTSFPGEKVYVFSSIQKAELRRILPRVKKSVGWSIIYIRADRGAGEEV